MSRRSVAIAVACAVAGALQALHLLAFGTLKPLAIAYDVVLTAIELVALSAIYDRKRSLLVIGAAALALSLAAAFAGAAVTGNGMPVVVSVQFGLYDGVLALGLWALAVAMPEARARTAELERLRAAAELATLRAHVQPHFLLNTLNTIAALTTEDPAEARELVAALGDLLRDALEDRGETHTLAAEIAWLQRYARVIEIRHHVRFRWDVATASENVQIPRMLLQPLVENAVKHGALRCRDGGEIAVSARLDGAGTLRCTIEDNGPGLQAPRDGGLGLELVTRRLSLGGHGTFRLERAGSLTRAIVELERTA